MAKEYPKTGALAGIYEQSSDPGQRKTLWTQIMCKRGCNLCIGLYWAITHLSGRLPLGRIGTHSVECLFGTTRCSLRGDTGWKRFISAQVDAIIAQKLLKDLNMQPYIRRFRNVSGCRVTYTQSDNDDDDLAHADFDGFEEKLQTLVHVLTGQRDKSELMDENSVMMVFVNLAANLVEVGYVERITSSSSGSGSCIMSRFWS
jgi:hypothetical protein